MINMGNIDSVEIRLFSNEKDRAIVNDTNEIRKVISGLEPFRLTPVNEDKN